MDKNSKYKMSNGVEIPVIGFGTWQIAEGEDAYNSTLHALKVGYRHIDTARAYGNERSVGQAIKDSGLKREEVFITTKLPAECKGYDTAIQYFNESLEKLGVDYLDLYLIHAPKPWHINSSGMEYMDQNIETWKAFEVLYKEGKCRAIGVSNFETYHLIPLLEATTIVPHANQIQINPNYASKDTVRFCREKNILLEAYSPFATGRIFSNERIEKIAEKYNTTIAKVCMAWSLQNGFLPLPKSVNKDRIEANLNVFDLVLSEEDLKEIGEF